MKLTITCLHCQKENEILLQSMCITPKKEEPKKYALLFLMLKIGEYKGAFIAPKLVDAATHVEEPELYF